MTNPTPSWTRLGDSFHGFCPTCNWLSPRGHRTRDAAERATTAHHAYAHPHLPR